MKVVEVFAYSPGVCCVCGCAPMSRAGDDEPDTPDGGIDLEIEIDYGDQAYMCFRCAGLVAELIGYIPPDMAKSHESRIAKLESDSEEAQLQIDRLQSFKDRVMDGRRAMKEARSE